MEGKSFRRRHDFRTPRLFVPVLLNLIAVPVIVFTRSATMFSFPISLSLSPIVAVELHRVVTLLASPCLMFI